MATSSQHRKWDVLGLGCVSVDDLLYVQDFPPPDVKTRVLREERQCGGLTGTALVAAARLGARAAYVGLLGDGELSRGVEENFAAAGVNTSLAVRRPDAGPVHSTIVVGTTGRTRNIFFRLTGRTGADDSAPDAGVIRAAKVLLVDHYGVPGNLRAIDIGRAAGVQVVADFERDDHPRFGELLAAVNHLVVSETFATKITGAASASDAAPRLWTPARRAVVITAGERGCWFIGTETGGRVVHRPAFRVDVIDTTGCGDVFHGAYAAALARDMSLPERVDFACAAAAIKATVAGGQKGAPDLAAVARFLGDRRGE
jgi:sugar/nucleoside kinase (ribokinase family)